jgi:hypothetical protein
MLRRGGLRQRLRVDPPAHVPHAPRQGGNLAEALEQLWAWGVLSAPGVQLLALAAVKDGLSDTEILELSRCGSSGTQIGNISRDLTRRCGRTEVPRLHSITVPAISPRTNEVLQVEAKLLLPHQLFAHIGTTQPELFETFKGAGLRSFWAGALAAGDPHLHAHPVLAREGYEDLAVPLFIYGDAAPFSKSDSIEVMSFGAALCREGTWQAKYMLASWVSSSQVKGEGGTWDVFLRVIVWSLNALFSGVHPDRNYDGSSWGADTPEHRLAGSPLVPGGFWGVVHGICGDLAWLQERVRLHNCAPNARNPCPFCLCDRVDLPFKDLRRGAAWQATVKIPPQPRPSTSPFFDLTGVTLFSVRLDMMHVFDSGFVPHFTGSVLWLLIFDHELPGRTIRMRVNALWSQVSTLYRELGIGNKVARLDLSSFCDPTRPHADYPTTKRFKASENRAFLPVLAALCTRYNSGNNRDRLRLQCAENLVEFTRITGGAGHFLTAAEVEASRAALFAGLEAYMRLSAIAANVERRLLFNVVNKHHFCAHLASHQQYLNPEICWQYQYEDFMGRIARVCAACTAGTVSYSIPGRLMSKYRRVLHSAIRS